MIRVDAVEAPVPAPLLLHGYTPVRWGCWRGWYAPENDVAAHGYGPRSGTFTVQRRLRGRFYCTVIDYHGTGGIEILRAHILRDFDPPGRFRAAVLTGLAQMSCVHRQTVVEILETIRFDNQVHGASAVWNVFKAALAANRAAVTP